MAGLASIVRTNIGQIKAGLHPFVTIDHKVLDIQLQDIVEFVLSLLASQTYELEDVKIVEVPDARTIEFKLTIPLLKFVAHHFFIEDVEIAPPDLIFPAPAYEVDTDERLERLGEVLRDRDGAKLISRKGCLYVGIYHEDETFVDADKTDKARVTASIVADDEIDDLIRFIVFKADFRETTVPFTPAVLALWLDSIGSKRFEFLKSFELRDCTLNGVGDPAIPQLCAAFQARIDEQQPLKGSA